MLRAEHDFDFATLTSLSAFRQSKAYTALDQDASPIRSVSAYDTEGTESFQQELLLHGSTDALDWTGGVFYFHDKSKQLPLLVYSASTSTALNHDQYTDQTATSYAAYGQGTYKVTDSTDITAGFRYSIEDRAIHGVNYLLSPPAAKTTATIYPLQKASFGNPTARFAVDQHLSDAVMVYVSYNRGFKSGEFNNTSPSNGVVQPETLNAYEAGVKSEFLDHRLRLNASAFYYDYSNIQLTALTLNSVTVTNAAQGTLKGIDVDMTAAPPVDFGHLELTSGLEILHGVYDTFLHGVGFQPSPAGGNITVSNENLSGHTMIRAPGWTLSTTANYEFPIYTGKADLNLTVYHNSGFYWDPDNRLHQSPYTVLNSEISYTTSDDRWRFKIYARNLLDTIYFNQASSSAVADVESAAPPRTVGVGVDFRY
jgi:iron complex outermembrane receptor protein